MNFNLPFVVAISISILLMASTIMVSAFFVLRVRPLPYWQALVIALVSNLLGKLFVSILHWPGVISYSLPTLVSLGLTYQFFKPKFSMLMLCWIVGFAMYLIIHLLITNLFGWTFMFPFWAPRITT